MRRCVATNHTGRIVVLGVRLKPLRDALADGACGKPARVNHRHRTLQSCCFSHPSISVIRSMVGAA